MKNHKFSLDFITKFYLTMLIGIIAITGNLQYSLPYLSLLISIFPFVLLLLHGRYIMCIKCSIMIVCAWLLERFAIGKLGMLLDGIALFFVGIVIRMMPGVIMGYYTMYTSTMSDMVKSMRNIKVPEFIIIPVSLLFRFFYSIREDYSMIRDAMKMHELNFINLWNKPEKLVEYRIVPLLMCSTKTADDVAISAMTRGMVLGKPRSSVSDARLRIQDYVLMLLFTAVFILSIFYRSRR